MSLAAEAGAALSITAPAKINLTLRVTGRRADGYHLLDSLVVFTELGDELTVRAPLTDESALSLAVEGPFAAPLNGESDNLVLRAARKPPSRSPSACRSRRASAAAPPMRPPPCICSTTCGA